MQIAAGELVEVVDALGQRKTRRAVTGVIEGHDFTVVWVCTPQEWEAAHRAQREPDGFPFPAEDVSLAPPADSPQGSA